MKKKIKLLKFGTFLLAPAATLITLSCSVAEGNNNPTPGSNNQKSNSSTNTSTNNVKNNQTSENNNVNSNKNNPIVKNNSQDNSKLIPFGTAKDFLARRQEATKNGKKWIGWNNPKFVAENRKKSLSNFSYADEAETVKAIAPFNKEAKRSNVMYQLLVYSFADGNNDGIGDFIGLKNNLDYFTNLGIDTLYLSPIFPSSTYHGYDAIDYTAVAPELGGMEAFDAFLTEAHKNGIRVVLDMAFNHTSYEHPWFQSALLEKDPTFKQFYNFYTDVRGPHDKEGKDTDNIRTYFKNIPQKGEKFINKKGEEVDIKSTNKTWVAEFWAGMPDLNLKHRALQKELEYVHYFWAKKGVDGFRYDAFYHFFESANPSKIKEAGTSTTNLLLSQWRQAAEKGYADAEKEGVSRSDKTPFMFGEWWGDPAGNRGHVNAKEYWFHNDSKGEHVAIGSLIDGTKWRYNNNVSISPDDEKAVLNSLIDKNGNAREWLPHLNNHDIDRWITNFRNTVSHGVVGSNPNTLTDQERSAYEYAVFSLLTRGGTPTLYMGDEILMQGGNKGEGDTKIREPWYWGDISKQVYFQDERDGAKIEPLASVGEGNTEYLVSKPDGAYQTFANLIKIRKKYPSVSEQKVEHIADPNIVVNYQPSPGVYQDDFRYNETVLRDNHDGTYILFVFNGDNKPVSNLWLKKEFEIKETLLAKNVTSLLEEDANSPFPGQIKIQGTGKVKLAAFLIGKKDN